MPLLHEKGNRDEIVKSSSLMQVQVNTRATFTFVLTIGFVYLAYLIFFRTPEDFPEIDVNLKDIISYAVLAVEMGGHAVAQVYAEKRLQTEQKGLTDEGKAELLTQADLISNFLILDVLKRFPQLDVVSEEKDSSITEKEVERYRSDKYALWLSVRDLIDKMPSRRLQLSDLRVYVDPLDATQEFTEGLTEYVTVMACVVSGDEPIFGAIYRPFFNQTLFGISNWGVMNEKGERVELVRKEDTPRKIVVSRSHAGSVKELAEKAFGSGYEVEPAGGSGYKTWRLVNGTAELYVHQTAIKKWDTCAGDAILRAAGGTMLNFDGSELDYGKESNVLNKRGLIAAVRTPYTYFEKLKPYVEKPKNDDA